MGSRSADNLQLVFAGAAVNVELEGAGHAAYMDDPRGWHESLLEFLARQRAGGAGAGGRAGSLR